MTNPNNSVGTNGAFGGRTSVNAFNDVMAAFIGRGIISGWGISPSSGMTVAIGGDGVTRDVAVAEDNAGNKTSVNNISQAPISLAVTAAPATNNRIDAIVAYVDNPPTGASTVVDNYGVCGLIDVPGTVSASPSAPDEAAIRTAITTDGGAGATAYYVVIGYVTIAAGTTDITSDMIEAGPYAQIGTNQISDGSVTSDKIDWATRAFPVSQQVTIGSFIDGNGTAHTLYRKYYLWGNQNITQNGFVSHYVSLTGATILATNWVLYRSDVPGIITAQGPYFYPIFVSGGADLRLYTSGIPAQSGASVMGWVEYYI